MKQPHKRYDITQCALYKCTNQRRLEGLLGLGKYDLNHIQKVIEYHSFEIDKKGTTEKREITAPKFTIKQVQARIHKLLQSVERPDWLISGEKGKCYIQNGEAHIQSNYVLAVDVRKFYDNCRREYVFRFFADCLKTSGDVAGILADVVTYRGGIPTGCPTSQLIAYYAYRNMFEEISEAAVRYGCKFTLYVDDMTFSSTEYFPHKKLANEIDVILRKYGHRPKYRKVKFYATKESKPITGTVVTSQHTLDVPNSLRKRVYDNFQSVKHICLDKNVPIQQEEEKTILSLRGQLNAVNSINDGMFPEIKRLTRKIAINPESPNTKRRKSRRLSKISIPHTPRPQSV